MKTLFRFVSWLYPRRWRERYGVEFSALLEDVRPGWQDLFNVMKGALAMQVKSFGVMAAGCAMVGALVAGLVSWRIPDMYVSSATVRLSPPERLTEVPALIVQSTSRRALAAIIEKHNLYERDRTQKPLETVIEEMRHDIQVRPTGDSALTVAFLDWDPARARQVTRELINLLMENNVRNRRAGMLQPNMEVINPASLPSLPVRPNRLLIYGLGIAMGALTGVMAAWLRRAHPRVA